jgi:hypothetical protein
MGVGGTKTVGLGSAAARSRPLSLGLAASVVSSPPPHEASRASNKTAGAIACLRLQTVHTELIEATITGPLAVSPRADIDGEQNLPALAQHQATQFLKAFLDVNCSVSPLDTHPCDHGVRHRRVPLESGGLPSPLQCSMATMVRAAPDLTWRGGQGETARTRTGALDSIAPHLSAVSVPAIARTS